MHGTGVYECTNGAKYNGNWVQDLRHGFGQQIFKNGDSYEGNFYEG